MSEIAGEVEGMAGRGVEEGDGSSMMWRLVWVKQSIVVCNMASGRFVQVSEVERGVGNAVTGFICRETAVVDSKWWDSEVGWGLFSLVTDTLVLISSSFSHFLRNNTSIVAQLPFSASGNSSNHSSASLPARK